MLNTHEQRASSGGLKPLPVLFFFNLDCVSLSMSRCFGHVPVLGQGNVACDEQGGGRLIFYDFGMMDELRPSVRSGLVNLIFSTYENEPRAVCDALVEMGVLRAGTDRIRSVPTHPSCCIIFSFRSIYVMGEQLSRSVTLKPGVMTRLGAVRVAPRALLHA